MVFALPNTFIGSVFAVSSCDLSPPEKHNSLVWLMKLLGFFEGDEHDIYETDILTLPHSIDIIWKGQHKGLCRCYRDSKIQRMGWKGERERGREEEWGHLLWPRQGINKQTGCQTISTPTEQTGRLTNLDHIYGREPGITLLRQVQCWNYTQAASWQNLSNRIQTTTFLPFNHLSLVPILLNFNSKLTSAFTF